MSIEAKPMSNVELARPSKVNEIGVILFLVSEFFLFGALFFSYYFLKLNSAIWPPPDVNLSMIRPIANTVILLTSSVTLAAALSAWRRGIYKTMSRLLVITAILGISFLAITAWEWSSETFRPWSHAYGSIFFTLTGFHALHVLGGIILLTALYNRARLGLVTSSSKVIEVSSWYWHYVDAIWILVFTTIFIVR